MNLNGDVSQAMVRFNSRNQRIEDAIASAQKHTKVSPWAKRVLDNKAMTSHDKMVSLQLMDNYAKLMDDDLGAKITMSPDYGPYIFELLPVIAAWYAEFPLKDLISIQPMDKPLAYLFFSKLKAGTSKSPTVQGDLVETPVGPRVIKGSYPTGEVIGEAIPVAQMEFNASSEQTIAALAYAPISLIADYKNRIKVVLAGGTLAGTYTVYSVIGNTIHLANVTTPTVDSGHTIDIATGALIIQEPTGAVASTVTSATVNYVWNIEYATVDTIQRVKETIDAIAMEATPRALMLEWTLFAEYLKKSQFGVDIKVENTSRVLNLMYQFQVRYILDRLYAEASGNVGGVTPNIVVTNTPVSLEVKNADVIQQLAPLALQIQYNSGRIEGNRIVTGGQFKYYLESLPDTMFKPTKLEEKSWSCPREIGTYSKYKVYYDDTLPADEAFMTYKGSEWFDAAYYTGTFVPVAATQAIAQAVTVRESFVSMEAHLYHKPNCVIPFKIS
jgi:uncharacterized membrane protein